MPCPTMHMHMEVTFDVVHLPTYIICMHITIQPEAPPTGCKGVVRITKRVTYQSNSFFQRHLLFKLAKLAPTSSEERHYS